MSRTGLEIRASENQSKFIQDRISLVEKHFGQLCGTMSSITRKTAKLRDKGLSTDVLNSGGKPEDPEKNHKHAELASQEVKDTAYIGAMLQFARKPVPNAIYRVIEVIDKSDQLAKDLVTYSEADSYNPSMLRNLTECAANMSAIQDYRQAQVVRLENKVVQPLSNYGLKCKQTKNDLKSAFNAREREHSQKRKLDQIRSKTPLDRAKISQAEAELQKASVEASRTTKNLEQQTDKFELEKLKDLKKILGDFINIEMLFHAKALEVYTQCYQNIAAIDTEEDIEEFRSKLQPPSAVTRMNMVRSSSFNSLNTTENARQSTPAKTVRQQSAPSSVQTTPTRHPPQPAVNGQRIIRPNISALEDDDDDDDDDDEDDEDDEDEDDDDDEYESESELETSRSRQQPQPKTVAPR